MIHIVEQFQPGRPNQTADFCPHLRGFQKIPHMVSGNIQSLQVQTDLFFFCHFHTVQKCAVHGAELCCMGEILIMIYHNSPIAQGIGMDRHTGCPYSLCRLNRFLQVFHILFPVFRINQGIIRIPVKSADGNPRFFRCFSGIPQIPDPPVPKFHSVKAVLLCCQKSFLPGQFCIQSVNTGTFSQTHFHSTSSIFTGLPSFRDFVAAAAIRTGYSPSIPVTGVSLSFSTASTNAWISDTNAPV